MGNVNVGCHVIIMQIIIKVHAQTSVWLNHVVPSKLSNKVAENQSNSAAVL